MITISYDYKLTFLLFALPQIIEWSKQDHSLVMPSSLALLGIIATLYLSPFFYPWLLDEIINWFL